MNPYLGSWRPVQLRLATTIARHGKQRQAAGSCSMTLPAASPMLADMETQLGAAPFERTAKGMRPTPSGEVPVRYARKLTYDLDRWRRTSPRIYRARRLGPGGGGDRGGAGGGDPRDPAPET